MAPRKQFTFYQSYWDSISKLPPDDQLSVLCAVIQYALYEAEPQSLSPYCHAMFELIRPVLDSGRRRAEAGSRGGSQRAANATHKTYADNTEANNSNDTAKSEAPKILSASDGAKKLLLDVLWDCYPVHRRQNRDQASVAWDKLTAEQQQAAVKNLDNWLNSKQWLKDNGEYIPNICNYLDPGKKYITNPPAYNPLYHLGFCVTDY